MTRHVREPLPDHVAHARGAVQGAGIQLACGLGLFAALLLGFQALEPGGMPSPAAVAVARDSPRLVSEGAFRRCELPPTGRAIA